MEESQGKDERDESLNDAPLDSVDHGRLARLVAKSPAQGAVEGQSPGSVAQSGAVAVSQPFPARQQSGLPPAQASPVTYAPAPQSPAAHARQKKSYTTVFIIALIAALLLLAGGAGVFLMTGSKAGRPANLNKPPDGKASIKPDLIALPGGTFQMGRSDGAEQEGPPHAVTVAAFSIDRTEVTNAEYAQFVQETKHPAPRHFVDGRPVAGQEQWPVTNVSLDDAKAFAAWRSKRDGVTYRLPTEEEWEYAARDGSQGTIFPWGDKWADNKANVDAATLKPVGASPEDKTRAGVVDMIGNAYEWTSSKASYYPGSKGQVRAENREWVVVRGGAYITDSSRKQISAAFRDWIPPSMQNAGVGFRLVRSQ